MTQGEHKGLCALDGCSSGLKVRRPSIGQWRRTLPPLYFLVPPPTNLREAQC